MAFAVILSACSSSSAPSQSAGEPEATIQAGPTSEATVTAPVPIEETLSTAAVPSLAVAASPTARPRRMFGPGPVEIPILLYHHVDPVAGGRRYAITADLFRDQMQVLADGGYETVTISEVAAAIRSGAELPARPIVVTFDDGNEDTYAEGFPILSSYGFRGVVFGVGNRTGAEGFLTAEELLALVEAGWEIGSHGWSHVDLTTLSATQWRQEILGSKLELERVLGLPVKAFAYPFGSATAAIIAKVAEYGYSSGAGLGSANHHDRGSVYYLGRREIYGYWTLEQFRMALENSEQWTVNSEQ